RPSRSERAIPRRRLKKGAARGGPPFCLVRYLAVDVPEIEGAFANLALIETGLLLRIRHPQLAEAVEHLQEDRGDDRRIDRDDDDREHLHANLMRAGFDLVDRRTRHHADEKGAGHAADAVRPP